MRVLLDTHTLLWFLAGDERLSLRGRQIIGDPTADLLFSVASLWEIAVKHSLGKLPLARPFAETFPAQLDANAFATLPIRTDHLARLVDLPLHHRDPFDRLIIAQALAEGVPVLTRDRAFDAYAVDVIWDGPAG